MRIQLEQEETMDQFPASALTRQTSDLLDAATKRPVAITKHSKPRFVIMSYDDYNRMASPGRTQLSVSTTDIPEPYGALLDQGLEDLLKDD
jgi:prevent-host-death family protein